MKFKNNVGSFASMETYRKKWKRGRENGEVPHIELPRSMRTDCE